MRRIIETHVEASKIGRQIAEQVLDHNRRVGNSSSDKINIVLFQLLNLLSFL